LIDRVLNEGRHTDDDDEVDIITIFLFLRPCIDNFFPLLIVDDSMADDEELLDDSDLEGVLKK
jgi:hypothetical protein